MAIGKISGSMLVSNLERQGIDLSVETNLLYIDVTNNRIGINNDSPAADLDIVGNIVSTTLDAGNVRLSTNTITTVDTDGAFSQR